MKRSPVRIDYSKKFEKQLKKAPLGIKKAFRKRLSLFLQDPFNPQLSNHPLTGKLKGRRSINVTGDWRAIFTEFRDMKRETVITFHLLRTHSQLYG